VQQRLQISIKHTPWLNIEIRIKMIPVFHRATYCFAAGKIIRVPFPNERAALVESPGPADDDVALEHGRKMSMDHCIVYGAVQHRARSISSTASCAMTGNWKK
jgi:hypothetical protein